MFDAVSRSLSERSRAGKLQRGAGYRPPPWTWGIDADDRAFIRALPNVTAFAPGAAPARARRRLPVRGAGRAAPAADRRSAVLDAPRAARRPPAPECGKARAGGLGAGLSHLSGAGRRHRPVEIHCECTRCHEPITGPDGLTSQRSSRVQAGHELERPAPVGVVVRRGRDHQLVGRGGRRAARRRRPGRRRGRPRCSRPCARPRPRAPARVNVCASASSGLGVRPGRPRRRFRIASRDDAAIRSAASPVSAQTIAVQTIAYGCSSRADGRNRSRYSASAGSVFRALKWRANANGSPR